jgi:hypothetical protein
MAELRDARSVMASSVSSGTTRGELLFVPRSAFNLSKARRASDRRWLPWLQIALDQAPENRARIS